MKVRLSGLPVWSCFSGKNGSLEKKLEGGRTARIGPKGKVKYRKTKGDPEVEPQPCDLKLFGLGHRRNPEAVVQIGDGNLLRPGKLRPGKAT